MKKIISIAFSVFLLFACTHQKQAETIRTPKPGQWMDPQTNIRFTLEEKAGSFEFTSARDMDDREELVILESVFDKGVLRWSYYIPSTKYTVRCTSTAYTDDTLNIDWENDFLQGNEVLYRMK